VGVTDRADVIGQVAAILCARTPGHPLRVAVDGITSSGKTTFAGEVTAAVGARGRPTARVSMDGYHHRRSRRHRQGRLSGGGYYEDAYDLDGAARELLRPLGPDGSPGPSGSWRYRDQIIDLATDQPVDSWAEAPPDAVLVVDGSFLQREELRALWDEVIYLDVAFDIARARGAARDAAAFGGRDAAIEAFRLRYHAAGHRYLDEIDPGRRASIVVDNNDLAHPRLVRPPGGRSAAGKSPGGGAPPGP
jgi:uridine kinase